MVGLVVFEIRTRRERTAINVVQISEDIFPEMNAQTETNRRLICIEFILRSFFFSLFLRFLRVP